MVCVGYIFKIENDGLRSELSVPKGNTCSEGGPVTIYIG